MIDLDPGLRRDDHERTGRPRSTKRFLRQHHEQRHQERPADGHSAPLPETQAYSGLRGFDPWIPAFAGMTVEVRNDGGGGMTGRWNDGEVE